MTRVGPHESAISRQQKQPAQQALRGLWQADELAAQMGALLG
ncbi:hypothetical protein DLM_1676 [Aquitalea magnusonii]|uniref:Uncharacterized protein n=1 Tax=Aquitalea magnusonii TaxID=332411 RepID=A0A3G9GEP7_9NEIS|nr:hypothetical protein DLM_1676 [Aquitalea magnusonii]